MSSWWLILVVAIVFVAYIAWVGFRLEKTGSARWAWADKTLGDDDRDPSELRDLIEKAKSEATAEEADEETTGNDTSRPDSVP
jgi:hypothetical protein